MKAIVISLFCLVSSAAFAKDDCGMIKDITDLLRARSPILSQGPDGFMNEDREADDNYYLIAAKTMPGADSCSISVDPQHKSLADAYTINYRCRWKKADGQEAMANAKSMMSGLETCLGVRSMYRSHESTVRSSDSYIFADDNSPSPNTPQLRGAVLASTSKKRGSGEVSLTLSIHFFPDRDD